MYSNGKKSSSAGGYSHHYTGGHTDWVTSVVHLPDGRVLSSGADGNLNLNIARAFDNLLFTKIGRLCLWSVHPRNQSTTIVFARLSKRNLKHQCFDSQPTYILFSLWGSLHIYIYIYREREIYIYIFICSIIYIYTYMYIRSFGVDDVFVFVLFHNGRKKEDIIIHCL